jgi:chitinase
MKATRQKTRKPDREEIMMKWVCAVVCMTVLSTLFAPGAIGGRPAIVGYYTDWSRGTYPASVIPYQYLTHIVHAFVTPNADGSLDGISGFAYPDLVQRAHQAGVKVILSIGGWGGSGGFSPMSADTVARGRFVQNVKAFLESNSYDGVDLDWEYPVTIADRTNLTALVHELRIAFGSAQRSISLAVPAGNWSGQWYDVSGMQPDIDWLGVMTYDYFGSWTSTSGPNSALYGTWSQNNQGWIDDSYTYYLSTRAIPASKILLGIPFYGYTFNSASMYGASTGAAQLAYQFIAPLVGAGWTRYWDSLGKVPYLINSSATRVVSYDDSESVSAKCSYVLNKGNGGVIIWALGQDYLFGNQPLLAALGQGLGLGTGVSDRPTMPVSVELFQNYPNPFNPSTTITYGLPRASHVTLTLYDVLGREAMVLVNERKDEGVHEITFDGAGLASGVYFYRLQAVGFVQTRTLVLMR